MTDDEREPIAEGSYEWYRREVERLRGVLAEARAQVIDRGKALADWQNVAGDHQRALFYHRNRADQAEQERDVQRQRAEQAEDRLRAATGAYARLQAQADDAEAARDRWRKRGKQAEAERDALKAAIEVAKAEHRPIECCNMRHDGGEGLHCAICEYDDPSGSIWPCPTARALDALSGADLSEPSPEKVVVVASRTHDLRVFTGSVEDAREFAASLVEQLRDQVPVSRNPYVPLTTQWTPENWRDAKNDSSSRFRRGITSCAWYGPAGLEIRIEDALAKPRHIGGRANAEDCPACSETNPPYPFICPGEDRS